MHCNVCWISLLSPLALCSLMILNVPVWQAHSYSNLVGNTPTVSTIGVLPVHTTLAYHLSTHFDSISHPLPILAPTSTSPSYYLIPPCYDTFERSHSSFFTFHAPRSCFTTTFLPSYPQGVHRISKKKFIPSLAFAGVHFLFISFISRSMYASGCCSVVDEQCEAFWTLCISSYSVMIGSVLRR